MCASVCVCFAEFLSVMYIHIHKHSHCAIHYDVVWLISNFSLLHTQRHFFRNLGSLLLYAFIGTTVSTFIIG